MMKAIVAVDENWAIGKENGLLFSIPEDMKFFRETTSGRTVVMGRKTLESFPGGRPLKNRKNIVFSRDRGYTVPDATVVHDIDELKEATEGDGEVFLIGGASIYAMLIDQCDSAYVTKMYTSFPADKYFPNLDEMSGWKAVASSDEREYEGIKYRFWTYRKQML